MRDQGENTADLIQRYLGINQGAVDRERRALIDFAQDQQDPGGQAPRTATARGAAGRTPHGTGMGPSGTRHPDGHTARRTAGEQHRAPPEKGYPI